MNSDSGHSAKLWYFPPEYAFTQNQKQRSRSARMSVHDRPEYAAAFNDDLSSPQLIKTTSNSYGLHSVAEDSFCPNRRKSHANYRPRH
ncbi:hypothetical protein, partial [Serratia marcescens]|uniref:hypothetical protein n=1 Tax=Serratia marcescens TaxID=615 RepID=UPI001BB003D3